MHNVAVSTPGMLWAALLVCLPIQRLWRLPWFGETLQLPEIIALALGGCALRRLWTGPRPGFLGIDVAVGGLVAAVALSLIVGTKPATHVQLREALGLGYLAALYVSIRILATPGWMVAWPRWFITGATLAGSLGIGGVILAYLGHVTPLVVYQSTPLPGLATAYRATGLTAGPQMLAGILIMAVLLQVWLSQAAGWRPRDRWRVALLTTALVLTLSKTVLCLAAGLATLAALKRPGARLPIAAGVAAAVTFVVLTHWLPVRADRTGALAAAMITGDSAVAHAQVADQSWVIVPTTYLFNKRASIDAIRAHWPKGLGLAEQAAFAGALQREGRYPAWIGAARFREPHSTYLGVAAELGAAGLLALIGLACTVALTAFRGLRIPATRATWIPLTALGVVLLLEATSADLLNSRHYWIWLAMAGARAAADRATPGGETLGPAPSAR